MVVYCGHHTSQKWTNGQRFPLQSLRRLILHIHSCTKLKVTSFLDCCLIHFVWLNLATNKFDHDIDFANVLMHTIYCYKFVFSVIFFFCAFSSTANIYSGNWDTGKKVYKLQVCICHTKKCGCCSKSLYISVYIFSL